MSQMQQVAVRGSGTVDGSGECHVIRLPVQPGSSGSADLFVKIQQPNGKLALHHASGTISRPTSGGLPIFSCAEATLSELEDAPEWIKEGVSGNGVGYLDVYVTAPQGSVVTACMVGSLNG